VTRAALRSGQARSTNPDVHNARSIRTMRASASSPASHCWALGMVLVGPR